MIMFRSCARCSGDRTVETDGYGEYVTCLQCGHVSYQGVAMTIWQGENRARLAPFVKTGTDKGVGSTVPSLARIHRGRAFG